MSIQNIDKIKLQITGLYGDQTGQTLLFLIPVNRNQRLIREAAYSAKRFLDYAQDVFSGQPIKPLVEIRLILTDGTDVPFATELNVPDRIAQALKIFSSQLAD